MYLSGEMVFVYTTYNYYDIGKFIHAAVQRAGFLMLFIYILCIYSDSCSARRSFVGCFSFHRTACYRCAALCLRACMWLRIK